MEFDRQLTHTSFLVQSDEAELSYLLCRQLLAYQSLTVRTCKVANLMSRSGTSWYSSATSRTDSR